MTRETFPCCPKLQGDADGAGTDYANCVGYGLWNTTQGQDRRSSRPYRRKIAWVFTVNDEPRRYVIKDKRTFMRGDVSKQVMEARAKRILESRYTSGDAEEQNAPDAGVRGVQDREGL